MPSPTPDYIPKEVVDKAAALGLKPNAYALKLGLHENGFYKFFGKPHTKLKPYLLICQAGGITLDELVLILENGKFSELVEKMMQTQSAPSIPRLARKIGVSDEFLYQRIKNPGINGLASYLEMAQRLNFTLERLVSLCSL